jgi:hypothetical protein
MVAEAMLDRNNMSGAREVPPPPRTVTDHLGDAVADHLLLMCRINNNDDLPQVFHEWAAQPRSISEQYTLQQSVDSAAEIIDVSSFEVTPTQVMAFKTSSMLALVTLTSGVVCFRSVSRPPTLRRSKAGPFWPLTDYELMHSTSERP